MKVGIKAFVLLPLLFAAGCSSLSLDNVLPDKQAEYKKEVIADKQLEVPPDLTSRRIENRIPGLPGGASTTYSEYTGVKQREGGTTLLRASNAVLPDSPSVQVMRDGRDRWLVIEGPVDAVWDKVVDFWQESGILLDQQDPEAGVMQTGWLENRADVKNDMITDFIRGVFDGLYGASTRDRYRVRLEEGEKPGTTELYLVHFGMEQEFVTGTTNEEEQIYWKIRERDPDLEVIMMRRIMNHLGLADAQAKAALAAAKEVQGVKTRLQKGRDGVSLSISEPFSRAWRLTGLALDRVGFTVEDRNRSQGIYYVRYNDPTVGSPSKGGWLSKLAFWRDDETVDESALYLVRVASADGGARVEVADEEGQPLASDTAQRILTLIQEQLK